MRKRTSGQMATKQKGWLKPYLVDTWQLYLMMLVPIIYIICFKYKPMLGVVIAFKKYNAFNPKLSMWDMPWVCTCQQKLDTGNHKNDMAANKTVHN